MKVTDNIFRNNFGVFLPFHFRLVLFIVVLLGVLQLIGVYPFFGNTLGAIIALLLALPLAFVTIGFELNFDNRKYKEYVGLFGLRIGKWKKLPKLRHVAVKKAKITAALHSRGSTTVQTDTKYKVFLIGDGKVRILAANDYDNNLSKARQLSSGLQINLVNTTGKVIFNTKQ